MSDRNQHHVIEPIRFTIRVKRPVADAFRLFTERMGSWWPVDKLHARGNVVQVVFEQRLDGSIYEICMDGETADWGRVLAWEPPHRFVMSWYPGRNPEVATEIEVRFTPEAAAVTRIDIEHRGWERLGESGEMARYRFLNGWPAVITRFEQAAAKTELP